MTLTYGSLFSGVGGFDQGFDRAGMVCRWQVEIDRFANRVLEARWPGVKRYGDIREIDPAGLPPVDVVCGGFPCQDLSVAGRRAGLGGERSGLWWEFHRVLAGLSPRWCVIENVPGLLSSNGGRDMGTILGALGELGYGWAYRVLDAQFWGVAQRRRRVFIVGCLGDGASAAEVLFEPESCKGDTPPSRETGTDVARCLGASTGGVSGKEQQATFIPVAGTLCNNKKAAGSATQQDAESGLLIPVARCLTADGMRMDGDTETFICTPAVMVPVAFQEAQTGVREYATAGTLRANGPGHDPVGTRIRQCMACRRLTPRECELLMGWPPGHTCLCGAQGDTMTCRCPDGPRYRACGNGVVGPVAYWIAARIRAVDCPPDRGVGEGWRYEGLRYPHRCANRTFPPSWGRHGRSAEARTRQRGASASLRG